jgi:hypothetical protein
MPRQLVRDELLLSAVPLPWIASNLQAGDFASPPFDGFAFVVQLKYGI